nr:Fe-S cluster assembly protein SufD [Bacilli bacterium]
MNELREQTPLTQDVKAIYGEKASLESRIAGSEGYATLPEPNFGKGGWNKRNVTAFQTSPLSTVGQWQSIVHAYQPDGFQQPTIVLADGHVVMTQGLDALHDQGVIAMPLSQAEAEHASLVKEAMHSVIAQNENRYVALNSALWRDGLFLYLPKGIIVEKPIVVLSVTTQGGAGTFVRHLLIAKEQAQATVLTVDLAASDLAEELHVNVSEALLSDYAHVTFGVLHDFPKNATNHLMYRAKLARGAKMDWVIGELSEGYTVSEFASLLDGEGSSSTSHAVALGSGRANLNFTARMVHNARFSESDTMARGVMKDRAEAVFTGNTHILRGASGSNGLQSERLLMLSPKSKADAVPMLLIDENDVKCGHAASVGQINEEQLFYLMSRGISEQEAKRMIVWGFIDPVLTRLPVTTIKEAVEAAIERKMG